MIVVAHPASKPHFDALLYQEIKIMHEQIISLVPILQNLATFNEAIAIVKKNAVIRNILIFTNFSLSKNFS